MGGDSCAYRGPSNDLDGRINAYVVLERAASYITNAVVVVLAVSFSLRMTRFFMTHRPPWFLLAYDALSSAGAFLWGSFGSCTFSFIQSERWLCG